MGLFSFVSGGIDRLFGGLDAKMVETLDIGLNTMRANAHVVTGHMKSTIGGEYNRSTKTVQIHIDAPYALIEAGRGGAHDFITPGCRAMGNVWGGSFEVHLPHATLGRHGMVGLRRQEGAAYRRLGRAGRKVTFVSRRYHRRYPEVDDAGVIL